MSDHPADMALQGEEEPARSSDADAAAGNASGATPAVPPEPAAVIELEVAAPEQWPLPEEALHATVKRSAAAALAEAALDGAEVARDGVPPLIEVLLADDKAIRTLNAQWRGKDAPTNVLSFPAPDEMPFVPDAPWPLGALALAGGVMRREAAARGVALEEHLCWMVVHGILHLLGYDHLHDEEAARMEALERRALARLGLDDPYAST